MLLGFRGSGNPMLATAMKLEYKCESYLGLRGMQLMIMARMVDGLGGHILRFEPGP